tara:strand:+ start:78 stop:500 length:423 start_codon:yes stop_codon:yes gene_type:complete
MSHFAHIDENGIVTKVLVIEQETIDSGKFGHPSNWIQTSYNTRGGKHYAPNSWEEDNIFALRKNFAGIGHTYDSVRDAFYAPQPYPSWILDESSCLWEPPIPYPDETTHRWQWDEGTQSWVPWFDYDSRPEGEPFPGGPE